MNWVHPPALVVSIFAHFRTGAQFNLKWLRSASDICELVLSHLMILRTSFSHSGSGAFREHAARARMTAVMRQGLNRRMYEAIVPEYNCRVEPQSCRVVSVEQPPVSSRKARRAADTPSPASACVHRYPPNRAAQVRGEVS